MLKLQTVNPCPFIFTQAPQDLPLQLQEEPTCLQATFSTQPNTPIVYGLTLTDSLLAIHTASHNQTNYLYLAELQFDLKIEVLYQQNVSSNKMLNAKEIGFKLIKGEESVQFYPTCQALASLWAKQFTQRLNQLGFHKIYKPVRKLGQGATAVVYEVVRLTDNSHFAAKAFTKKSTLHSQDTRKRSLLLNEISMLRSFDGENIVHCEAVFQSEHSIYIILELVKNDFLQAYNAREGLFSDEEVKRFMQGMALGLNEMHSSRVMHRDIKPENILLRPDMTPVISDLGMAADVDQPYICNRCGTPGYLAPEIFTLKKGEQIEPECDVFSLGAIFHVLLSGRPLFDGDRYDEIYLHNKSMQFDLSSPLYQQLDFEAMSLLRGMLETDPCKRIKAKDILKHPYLSTLKENEKEVISPATACSLRSISF